MTPPSTDLFYDASSIDYPIIDSDAHVNEPPELWQEGVPSHLRDRAPKVEHTEAGDLWIFDGGREKWPMGLTATAGQSFFEFSPTGGRYETMRPGSFDTDARLKDLDADGIYCQLIYPSVTLKGARIYSDDPELQIACVDAYNRWLLDFCDGSDGRLLPQAIIPATTIDDSVECLEKAMKDGHRAAVISAFPNGTLDPKDEDDRFWAVAQEADFPIAIHIGSFLPARRRRDFRRFARFCGRGWLSSGRRRGLAAKAVEASDDEAPRRDAARSGS